MQDLDRPADTASQGEMQLGLEAWLPVWDRMQGRATMTRLVLPALSQRLSTPLRKSSPGMMGSGTDNAEVVQKFRVVRRGDANGCRCSGVVCGEGAIG